MPLEFLEELKRDGGRGGRGTDRIKKKTILAPIMRTMQMEPRPPLLDLPWFAAIDLLCTWLVNNNYSSKYIRALLGENCWRSLYARLRVAPLLLSLSNMTVKKPWGKKWQPKNPKVEKHSFHVLLAPRMSCDHLFLFFFFFARFLFVSCTKN